MKTFYYDYDRGYFITAAGGVIALTPTLVYGEQADWQFVLKTATGQPYSLAGIVRWTAAVGTGGATVAGTAEGITADANAGTVNVPLDCDTTAFADAVAGAVNGVYGWFELAGYSATAEKIFYLRFAVAMTPVVNSGDVPSFADRVIAVVDSGGYITSSGAQTIASGAAQRATSGAIFSGSAFDTIIGSARITATSGGVIVSGLGASVTLSGGQIVASATDGEDREAHVTITSGGIDVGVVDPTNTAGVTIADGVVAVNTTEFGVVNGIIVNGRPVATVPVTSTDSETTSAHIEVLTGGTIYKFTQPLEVLSIGSATETTNADYVRFTLAPGATVDIPADVEVIASGLVFDAGGKYQLRFFDGTMTADFDVERPVANSTGAWYKSGAAVLASGMALADITVSGGETLNVYDRGWALRAVVNSGGTMNISSGGIGRNILTAQAGGRVNVSAGGVMSGVTLSGGPVTVSVGGAVAGAYIHSGNLGILGTAEDVVLYAGENLRVYPGGVISNTTVTGGVAYISSGGTAAGVIVSGGVVAPLAGASVTDVIIRDGAQYVSGIVSNITISGGTLRVFSGGSALAVTSLGGEVVVSSGGYVEYTE